MSAKLQYELVKRMLKVNKNITEQEEICLLDVITKTLKILKLSLF